MSLTDPPHATARPRRSATPAVTVAWSFGLLGLMAGVSAPVDLAAVPSVVAGRVVHALPPVAAQVARAGSSTPTADRCPMSVPLPTTPERSAERVPGPAWDLRCIELFPTASGAPARGVVQIRRPPSPFAVTVNALGYHVHDLEARIEGLPRWCSIPW